MKKAICNVFFAGLMAAAANAGAIADLYNTGVSSGGTALVGGQGTVDPHWTLLSGPGAATGPAQTYYNPAYFADSPTSRWISVNGAGATAFSGVYVFETIFTIGSGFNPATASVGVNCAVDNGLVDVTLNGNTVTSSCNGWNSTFAAANFNIVSGFVSGANSLRFTVVDFSQPMAFRAEFTSNVNPVSGVPEPSTIGMLGLAAFGLGWMKRRQS